VQKRVSYIELLPSSTAALPAVSIELASIKSTQRRSATINACRSSTWQEDVRCWVRRGPIGSDGVRLGPMWFDWVRWGN